MQENKKSILWFIGFCLFLTIGLYFSVKNKNRRAELLKGKTNQTTGIIIDKFVAANSGNVVVIRFEVNSDVNEIWYNKKYEYLEKGDTILIKYSVEDPTVIEVVDPCYMQKHKGKPYCK